LPAEKQAQRQAQRQAGPKAALLLTPGASADRNHSSLVAVDQAVSAHGIAVARIDLPSRKRPPAIIEVVREQVAALAERTGLAPERIVLGGRSMGGRMCSMAVAQGLPALGLVLISYPLHPPGRPEKLRIDHFGSLQPPCLFVSGTRDPFGTPEELQAHTQAIRGPVDHVWMDGGDHGLRRYETDVAAAVATWVLDLLA
jgi:hypothetical protein